MCLHDWAALRVNILKKPKVRRGTLTYTKLHILSHKRNHSIITAKPKSQPNQSELHGDKQYKQYIENVTSRACKEKLTLRQVLAFLSGELEE